MDLTINEKKANITASPPNEVTKRGANIIIKASIVAFVEASSLSSVTSRLLRIRAAETDEENTGLRKRYGSIVKNSAKVINTNISREMHALSEAVIR